MAEWVEGLVGDDWEEYCRALLRHRYNPVDVQAVPAIQGDLGLDFWIRGCGDIYQCYGPEAGQSVSERLRLQKRKLGAEVRTLKKNAARIAAMIAPAKCRRYVFLVPILSSKELLEYAATKSLEIQQAMLSFCAGDFEIAVQSLDDFAVERRAMQQLGLTSPRLILDDPDGQAVHDWLSDNGDLARTIREKIEAIHHSKDPEQIDNLVNEWVGYYLCGEDAMTSLQTRFPDLYEQTRRVITARRRRLRALGGNSASVPLSTLRTELDELTSDLSSAPTGMQRSDAVTLSTGTVATWLADCTLDPR
jgi:hypothetical protein